MIDIERGAFLKDLAKMCVQRANDFEIRLRECDLERYPMAALRYQREARKYHKRAAKCLEELFRSVEDWEID